MLIALHPTALIIFMVIVTSTATPSSLRRSRSEIGLPAHSSLVGEANDDTSWQGFQYIIAATPQLVEPVPSPIASGTETLEEVNALNDKQMSVHEAKSFTRIFNKGIVHVNSAQQHPQWYGPSSQLPNLSEQEHRKPMEVGDIVRVKNDWRRFFGARKMEQIGVRKPNAYEVYQAKRRLGIIEADRGRP